MGRLFAILNKFDLVQQTLIQRQDHPAESPRKVWGVLEKPWVLRLGTLGFELQLCKFQVE